MKNLVSRQHMRITQTIVDTPDNDGAATPSSSSDLLFTYHLEDLGSMNGILVNGTKIKDCILKDEDRIIIGAGKTIQYGQHVKEEGNNTSDLIYIFHHDPNTIPTRHTLTTTSSNNNNNHTESSSIRTVSRLKPIDSRTSTNLPQRSYSFKPSAKSRRSAAMVTPSTGDHENASNGTPDSIPTTTATASTPASASIPASASTPTVDSIDSPATADSTTRVKISLAQQLSAMQADTNAHNETTRRKRHRDPTTTVDESDPTPHDDKKQRVDFDPDELLARHAAELEARTAAAVESAVALATAAANSSAEEKSKVVATEARQALAEELSDEFQCAIWYVQKGCVCP